MSEQFQVETPENISFQYDIAGIGSRFLANLIDSLIQGSLYALLFFTVVVFLSATSNSRFSDQVNNLIAALVLLVIFLIQFGYFILFEIALAGQTPGKRLVGVRVMKENGYPLSVLDSIIRNIVRVIDFFPFAYGVGLIVMFLNARAKRLGDFAAGTIVVKMREQVKLSDLQRPTVAATPRLTEMVGLEKLREADIELVESFLQRRNQLRNPDVLAQTISQSVLARMNSPEARARASSMSADSFLRDVVAFYRRPKTNPRS